MSDFKKRFAKSGITPLKTRFARNLRRRATPSEEIAWRFLRRRRMHGLRFRRQQPLYGFIVDFYCAEYQLAIELDGPIHNQQRAYDAWRDKVLTSRGINIIRIRNHDLNHAFLHHALSQYLRD